MTTDIDDQTLGAYVDGELSDAERRTVSKALLQDTALRRRADELRASTAALRQALDGVLVEPIPANILSVFERRRTASTWQRAATPMALAAAVTLVIGSLSGYWLGQRADSSATAWLASLQPDAGDILDTTPSGAPVAWHTGYGDVELQPLLTFRDKEGQICRQYALTASGNPASTVDGVACRGDNGSWKVVFARPRETAEPSDAGGYSVASGGEASAVNKLVNALVGNAVSPQEERKLIATGWE